MTNEIDRLAQAWKARRTMTRVDDLHAAEQHLTEAAQAVRRARRSLRITYTCLGVTGFVSLFTLARVIGWVPPHSTSWITFAALGINLACFAAIAGLVLPLNRRLVRKAGAVFVERENTLDQVRRGQVG